MKSILIQANAKINLNFKILGKRPDGYHNIESAFQSIDLADFLSIEKAKKDCFSGGIICSKSENIILKAKNLLEKTVKKKLPCQIHLQKVIPISAGLGGGSADAAATLIGLNLLYNLDLNKRELAKIGIKIGADVPFFLYGGTRQISGRGERIKPIKKRLPRFFVVFRPHKRLNTEKMYKLYDKTGKDFLTLAKEIFPEINKLEKHLKRFEAKLKLTGKGPTVFCEINDYKSAKKTSEGCPNFNGDVFICRPQKEAVKIIRTQL